MMGIPADRLSHRREPCPFPPEQRLVRICGEVSTAWRDRERDREATAALISEAIGAIPGNVAVFFPSFAFRDAVEPLLDLARERPVLRQSRGMAEDERAAVLTTLQRGEGHVLLGVLGGIFSEGIDLPGDGLVAAIIVGPALPQANLERRLLQAWFEQRHGEGFRYAWLVPGMCRVVQAAGRVVRTAEDRGAIVLVGQRFRRRQYTELLPVDWSPLPTRSGRLGAELRDFFAPVEPLPDGDAPAPEAQVPAN
jgi:DNA excision repair protein ERCC-2